MWFARRRRKGASSQFYCEQIYVAYAALIFGKPFIQPQAPQPMTLDWGAWSSAPPLQEALKVSPLFLLGVAIATLLHWFFRSPR